MVSNLLLELRLKNFNDNPTQENFTSVLSLISKLSLAQLSSYCKNPTIRTLLDLPAFVPFWQSKLDAFTIKGSPEFRFRKSENLSEQEMVLGFYNFKQAMETPEKKDDFLEVALLFHSFHALRQVVNQFFILIKEKQFTSAFEGLPLLIEKAKWHGTPGYLLIANLYLNFAIHLKSDLDRSEAAMRYVFTYLEMAALAESDSVNAIHNAYYGKGLVASNQFKLAKIDEMKKACRDLSRKLSEDMIRSSVHAAQISPLFKPQRSIIPQDAFSEFHKAILADSPELIRAHFTKSQLEQKNSWGETPLLFATRHGKINSVRCLLSLGANPCAVASSMSTHPSAITEYQACDALLIARCLENKGIGRVILDHTPEISSQTEGQLAEQIGEGTPQRVKFEQFLLNFDSKDSLEEMHKQLDLGITPNLLLSSGETALSHMLRAGHVAGVELLMNFGASVNQHDANGETVLFCLLNNNPTKKTRALLETYFRRFVHLGADINARNANGETVLIKAVKNNDIEAVCFLLQQKGIDIDRTDHLGHDASFYADSNAWLLKLIEAARKRELSEKQTSLNSNYQSGKDCFFSNAAASSPPLRELPQDLLTNNSVF